MDQEKIKSIYKLNVLEDILEKCEEDISKEITKLQVKEADDNINFLLYTLGKSFVSIREVIILCWAGFPDGAFSIARNIYEQLIITNYIEDNTKRTSSEHILKRYNEDYFYQRAKCLKYEAQYMRKDNEKIKEYQNVIDELKNHYGISRMKDYWWVGSKESNFNLLCESVIDNNKEMESLLRLMHLMYKRACLSLHASCMGNRIRLGSDCAGIDMGPWEKGQENALFLSAASLIYIISVTYQELGIDGREINESLHELTKYYLSLLGK